MLQNAYLVAKIGADTAEKLPKKLAKKNWHFAAAAARRRGDLPGRPHGADAAGVRVDDADLKVERFDRRAKLPKACKSYAKVLQTFGGLVVGCIKTKHLQEGMRLTQHFFQALQDLPTFAPLQSQNFGKKSV